MWHPFLRETRVQQESGTQILPLWSCHDAVPWGKSDRRWMPRYSSDGDQLSRLRVFVLLALAQLVPSWSCAPGARVLVRNVQVLLCLAQRILNEFVSLCEPRGHVKHGHTSHMCESCELSVLLHSARVSAPGCPCPSRLLSCALALCTGGISQAALCFCHRTSCRQRHYKPGTHTSLKGHVMPSTFPSLCLSMQELCRAGLLGSWDQAVLSSLSLGSSLCRTCCSPQTSVVGDDSPWMAALWNLSASTSALADANWVSIMLH